MTTYFLKKMQNNSITYEDIEEYINSELFVKECLDEIKEAKNNNQRISRIISIILIGFFGTYSKYENDLKVINLIINTLIKYGIIKEEEDYTRLDEFYKAKIKTLSNKALLKSAAEIYPSEDRTAIINNADFSPLNDIDLSNIQVNSIFYLLYRYPELTKIIKEKLSKYKSNFITELFKDEDLLNNKELLFRYSQLLMYYRINIDDLIYLESLFDEKLDFISEPYNTLLRIYKYKQSHSDERFNKIFDKIHIPQIVLKEDLSNVIKETLYSNCTPKDVELILDRIIKQNRFDIILVINFTAFRTFTVSDDGRNKDNNDIEDVVIRYYKKYGYKNVFFDYGAKEENEFISVEELNSAKNFYKETAAYIDRFNFTPLEKYIVLYFITKEFKDYAFYENDKNTDHKYPRYSRDPYIIIKRSFIVCKGYINFKVELAKLLGIKMGSLSLKVPRGYHSESLTSLIDKEYDVEALIIGNPTEDSKDLYNFKNLIVSKDEVDYILSLYWENLDNFIKSLKELFPEMEIDEKNVKEFLMKINKGIDLEKIMKAFKNILEKFYYNDEGKKKIPRIMHELERINIQGKMLAEYISNDYEGNIKIIDTNVKMKYNSICISISHPVITKSNYRSLCDFLNEEYNNKPLKPYFYPNKADDDSCQFEITLEFSNKPTLKEIKLTTIDFLSKLEQRLEEEGNKHHSVR